jgi:glycogen synthase
MRILHLIYDDVENPWVGGGGAMRVREIYSRLAKWGHACTVVCGCYPGAADGFKGGVHYLYRGNGASFRRSVITHWIAANAYVLRHHSKFDVLVEDFTSYAPIISTLIARTPAVLQLQIFSSNALLSRFGVLAPIIRSSQKRYPALHKHAVYLTPQLSARWPATQQQRYHIGMGIPEHYLTTGTERRNFLLFLGRLALKAKGLDILANACSRILAELPTLRLIMAGKGPDESEVRRLFESVEKRFPGRIEFRGFVSGAEKEWLLANCEALVMPSREEGEGLCVTEAAAFGKPTIASDIQELQYVGNAGIGINTPVSDSDALAAAIEHLLKTGNEYDILSVQARDWASKRTWDRQSRLFESMLDDIIRHRKSPVLDSRNQRLARNSAGPPNRFVHDERETT